jgi:hypothetical protein
LLPVFHPKTGTSHRANTVRMAQVADADDLIVEVKTSNIIVRMPGTTNVATYHKPNVPLILWRRARLPGQSTSASGCGR